MSKHILYYISLVIVLAAGFGLAFIFPQQRNIQLGLIILTAFLYVIWGVIHHILHHSFSIKIMLEYIAIATLGISLILFIENIAL